MQTSEPSRHAATATRRWPCALAALALGAAMLATVPTAQAHGGMGGMGGMGMGGAMHGMAMPFGAYGGRGLERWLDRIDASAEQRTRIRAIADAARTDVQALHGQRRALADQALAAFARPEVDAAAAEALRQQMLRQHEQVSARMLQATLDIARVLTPAQRATLAEQVSQRRDQMERRWQGRTQPEGQRQ